MESKKGRSILFELNDAELKEFIAYIDGSLVTMKLLKRKIVGLYGRL
jgi:hypothetical protein